MSSPSPRLGFVRPDFPNERRVALLPRDIDPAIAPQLLIEYGFGDAVDAPDAAYARVGCSLASRDDVFSTCDAVFSLKLIQPADYPRLRPGQAIVGWTHPYGSGASFFRDVAQPLGLRVFDLDNITPRLFVRDAVSPISWLPRNFIWRNSYLAGKAAVFHALLSAGILPDGGHHAAVLSTGNVAQGALAALTNLGCAPRAFYRKTMQEFYEQLEEFDIIVNGIEVDTPGVHVLTSDQLRRLKPGCLIIDAAADAGNAIEGSYYTTFDDPIGSIDGARFYCVNNAPSIVHRTASQYISEIVSRRILPNIARFWS